MTKHTPGPWLATKNKHGIDGGHAIIAFVHDVETDSEADRQMIIHSAAEIGSPFADANLLAAAPDLLAAVKRCAGILAGEGMTKGELIRALESAQAAIRKAENIDAE